MMSIFGPRTLATAMEAIRAWDKTARSLPLLSEQIARMPDGPQSWSTTHSWPSVREALRRAGLVDDLPSEAFNGHHVPMTQITELGREVRAALSKQEGRS